MNASPATFAAQVRVARKINHQTPVYSTSTGDAPRQITVSLRKGTVCADVRKHGSHVLTVVLADLPGDRSVGYCSCGEYMDTGTWDERN